MKNSLYRVRNSNKGIWEAMRTLNEVSWAMRESQFRRLIWVPRAVADVGGGLEVEGQAAEAEAPEVAGRSQA